MQQVVCYSVAAGSLTRCCFTEGSDFTSTPLTATIPAGATTTTVRVPVINDSIVEGDEMFSMSLTVPPLLGPEIVAGSVTSATGIIVDSTSKKIFCKTIRTVMLNADITVRFTQSQYSGSEDKGLVLVTLELVGGTSSRPFDVTVTPLEQSPVSASNVLLLLHAPFNCFILGTADFNPTVINVTFNIGDTLKSSNIPVYKDNLMEHNETFNIVLSLSPFLNLRIKVDDENSVEGQIVDSTGKSSVYTMHIIFTM